MKKLNKLAFRQNLIYLTTFKVTVSKESGTRVGHSLLHSTQRAFANLSNWSSKQSFWFLVFGFCTFEMLAETYFIVFM